MVFIKNDIFTPPQPAGLVYYSVKNKLVAFFIIFKVKMQYKICDKYDTILSENTVSHCHSLILEINNIQGMIMAPVLHGPSFGSFRWSKCARRNLNAFLHSDESYCLFETAASSVEIEIPRVRIRSVSTRSIARV